MRTWTGTTGRAVTLTTLAAAAAAAVAFAPGVAQADQTPAVPTPYVHEYPARSSDAEHAVASMATGSDGLGWFTTWGGDVGRINADRTVSTFPGNEESVLVGLTPGSDGSLWASEWSTGSAVRIAPDGTQRAFPIDGTAWSVAAGSDGDVWYADAAQPRIVRVTSAGVVTDFPYDGWSSDGIENDQGLVAGGDGNLWFIVGSGTPILGRITTSGVMTPFPTGGRIPATLMTGPDGAPWVAFDDGSVAAIAADGTLTVMDVSASGASVTDSAVTADHRLWMLELLADGSSDIRTITAGGAVAHLTLPNSTTTYPTALSVAPDGTVWFAQSSDADDGTDFVTSVTPAGAMRTHPVSSAVGASTATSSDVWFGEIDGSVATTGTADVDRISGSNRYATSVALAQAAFAGTTADTVYVATGTNYPDALAAGPAAAKAGGPLLLTAPTSLPDVVAQELRSLAPKRVVIVGGTSAVSATVADQIGAAVGSATTVDRIAGTNRFDTSRRIVTDAFGAHAVTSAYVATGTNSPDALAAAAAAGAKGIPVVLVNGGASAVDGDTADLLRRLGVRSVSVIGGTSAVSGGIEGSLGTVLGTANVTRVAGVNRFDTAAQIAATAFPGGAPHVYVATGTAFPDALAGSALAAGQGAPLLTTRDTCVPSGTLSEIAALGADDVTVIGGVNALSADVAALHLC